MALEHPTSYIKYYRGIREYISEIRPQPARHFKTKVIVFVGPPGGGKSRSAADTAGPEAYNKAKGPWWDGYEGQESVIIDDFYGDLPYGELLQILDRYPYRVQVKGGTRVFNSKFVYITSNRYANEWYTCKNYTEEALYRRFNVYQYVENGIFSPVAVTINY